MATISDIFDMYAPQYTDDSRKTLAITLAKDEIKQCVFGDNYNKAVALLAAHELTVADRGGDPGAIAAKREGQLSISYFTASGSGPLSFTSYGQQLQRLRDQCIITPNISDNSFCNF